MLTQQRFFFNGDLPLQFQDQGVVSMALLMNTGSINFVVESTLCIEMVYIPISCVNLSLNTSNVLFSQSLLLFHKS